MTVLITGATGLIGRALTQSLVDAGLGVRVVTRRPHRALETFDARVTAFEWHPRTEPFPAPALEGVERIIHLMGEPLYGPLTRQARARVVASRRVPTSRLVEAMGRRRVHVIVASSAAVYGGGEGPPLTETTPVQPPKSKMALALLGCEEEAERLRESGSIVTHVRLGAVIAPQSFLQPLHDLLASRLIWRKAHPEAAIPAIDHNDAVALLTWLARSRPMPGAIHAVAPQPLATAELGEVLIGLSSARVRLELPRWALRRRVGVLADLIHNRQRIVPQRALDAGFAFSRPDPMESVRSALAQQAQDVAQQEGPLPGAVLQRT
jgi:NAD dependent epimerase/dehydratase family enzyme